MKTYKDLLIRATEILVLHLQTHFQPDDHVGQCQQNADTIAALVALLDGPEQRAVAVSEALAGLTMTLPQLQEMQSRTLPTRGRNHFFDAPAASTGDAAVDAFVRNIDLLHASLGLPGEVGEMLDPIKRAMYYGTPLDVENIKEEAGDVLWYLAGPLCRALGCTLEEISSANVAKLKRRYPDKYTDTAALARADKLSESV